MASRVEDQHTKDAFLIVWDVLGDLNVDDDPEIIKKLDQLRRVIKAIDVPKRTAQRARRAVDVLPPDAE